MPKAIWKGVVLADSQSTVVIDERHYFPPDSVEHRFLHRSKTHTKCPRKGLADYYNVVLDHAVYEDGAWAYPDPQKEAGDIRGYFAFWDGIRVE